jgi:DNA-binding NtrC family response regulator
MNHSKKTIAVIIVEDESILRMLAVLAFGDAGFEVIEAGNAQEAINILETKADGLHVLFTDVHMPGPLTGVHLANHVRDRWPWISVLVTSGRGAPTAQELPRGSRFVPKPYDLAAIAGHIKALAGAA